MFSFYASPLFREIKKGEGKGEEQDTGVFESNLKLSRGEGSDKGEGDEIEAQLVGIGNDIPTLPTYLAEFVSLCLRVIHRKAQM